MDMGSSEASSEAFWADKFSSAFGCEFCEVTPRQRSTRWPCVRSAFGRIAEVESRQGHFRFGPKRKSP